VLIPCTKLSGAVSANIHGYQCCRLLVRAILPRAAAYTGLASVLGPRVRRRARDCATARLGGAMPMAGAARHVRARALATGEDRPVPGSTGKAATCSSTLGIKAPSGCRRSVVRRGKSTRVQTGSGSGPYLKNPAKRQRRALRR